MRVHRRANRVTGVSADGDTYKRGKEAAEAKKVNIRKYPNVTELVPFPFAIEAETRVGSMARSCVRRYAPEQVEEERWQ